MKYLLIILLFPIHVFADICNVDLLIDESGQSGVYKEEVKNKASKCKSGNVMSMELFFANKASTISKNILFTTMSNYCDLSKSVEYDLSGLNFNLVCSYRRNLK